MKTKTTMLALIMALSLPVIAIAHGQQTGNINQQQDGEMFRGMHHQTHMPQHFNRNAMHHNPQLMRQMQEHDYNPESMHRFTTQPPCHSGFVQPQPKTPNEANE